MMNIWTELPSLAMNMNIILASNSPFSSAGGGKHMKLVYTRIHLPLLGINYYLVLISF